MRKSLFKLAEEYAILKKKYEKTKNPELKAKLELFKKKNKRLFGD